SKPQGLILENQGITSCDMITATPWSQNYVTPVMMSGIYWIEKNGNKNYSVATDAVDGLYLEALGFNSSFEYTYYLWNSSYWKDAIYELNGFNGTYPKIGYVLINSNMYYNGVYGYELSTHPSYDPPIYISNSSFEKFFSEPFEKVYYNSTYDNSQWVYVFIVNWTYIEKNG
ncbi:MAG: dolichyl-phosphate-mannose--protein mannosyltransferase, partial [Thermoplasmata archaeon]